MISKLCTVALVAMVTVTSAAQTYEMAWGRVLMDGSRTNSKTLHGSAAGEDRLIREYEPKMAELHEVIGCSEARMDAYRSQSPLGNWVADAMLEQGSKLAGVRCDVSVINVFGIRESMPEGEIKVSDLVTMFPFNNKMSLLKMRGARLKELFNSMAHFRWEAFGGAQVFLKDNELAEVRIGGELLDTSRLYNVVSIDFLLDGGDRLELRRMAEECKVYDRVLCDEMIEYVRTLTAHGKSVSGSLDRRIVTLDKPRPVSHIFPMPSHKSTGREISARHGRLTILHTNDTHSHIEPIRAGDAVGCAGVVERAAFVDSVRRADGCRNVLLLDAGDFSQGSPYFTLFHGDVEMRAMNVMKYDVSAVGNHEWDNGAAGLASLARRAHFKMVLCNYTVSDRKLQKLLKPYAIVRRGGLKIGIIGTLTNVGSVTMKDATGCLVYHDPVEPVNKWADYLKHEKGCDMVILLSHCGLSALNMDEKGDMEMAPHLHGVDLIIGGHTHDDLYAPVYVKDADGKMLTIVTDYCFGIYVGELKVF